MVARKTTDEWKRIEVEYCLSKDSTRRIADRNKISEKAIRNRAKSAGWVRKVRSADRHEPIHSPPAPRLVDTEKPSDTATIADGGRSLVHRMLDELSVITRYCREFEDMIMEATENDDRDAQRDAMIKAVSLPSRANTMKILALALKTLNEASAPQGKKAAKQKKAEQVASRFCPIGPPTLKSVE